ncbi:MAG: hypothetical protein ACP5E4_04180 [Candidatus Aenigmatarchaeota archaeon]
MHPVISAVLIMAFSVAVVSLVVSFGMPVLEDRAREMDMSLGRQAVDNIALLVSDLEDDPIGSQKSLIVEFKKGTVSFSGSNILYELEGETYGRELSGAQFNGLVINPGRATIKLTRTSTTNILAELIG